MNILGNSIKEIRKSKKMTQKQLSELTGFKQNTISNHENGNRQLDETDIRKYAKALNVKPQQLFDRASIQEIKIPTSPLAQKITETVVQLHTPRKQKVLEYANQELVEQNNRKISGLHESKLFEYKVYEKLAAGNGYNYFGDNSYDVVLHNEKLDHDFASWVFGDSMEPTYLNGEVVLIKQTGFDYDGAIYAVEWDGQTYIKKVYREEDGLRLVSLNSKYADKFAAYDEDPRIIGKIVGNFMPMEN
ncbi:XRE family transcriptional regulator [Streptococcus minor]|uniref:XRE family transcriptional regulator n=1 Tax=Streptococcus minor TaxID=229549 RepID=UPI00037B00A7|nr:helix-turn-helix transcriptional regulator [Streptococcus minor]